MSAAATSLSGMRARFLRDDHAVFQSLEDQKYCTKQSPEQQTWTLGKWRKPVCYSNDQASKYLPPPMTQWEVNVFSIIIGSIKNFSFTPAWYNQKKILWHNSLFHAPIKMEIFAEERHRHRRPPKQRLLSTSQLPDHDSQFPESTFASSQLQTTRTLDTKEDVLSKERPSLSRSPTANPLSRYPVDPR